MTLSVPALKRSEWDALLARLGPDRDEAGAEYELLRRRLVRYFEWRGGTACEDYADVVLTRVAKKLEAGEVIQSVQAYTLGVARFVLMESRSAPRLSELEEATLESRGAVEADPDEEHPARAACLDQCLGRLPRSGREIVLRYYEGDGRSRIANRRAIAHDLAVTERALRLRVFRIRETLEACLQACLQDRQRPAKRQ